MNKSAYPILVSLIALVLLSPTIGINHSFTENKSELLSNGNIDLARGEPYEVLLEYMSGETGEDTVTRNEEITIDFSISNTGDNDDTYDLSVTWNDVDNYGWYAEPVNDTIFVESQEQETIAFIFKAPVQGASCEDDGHGGEDCDDISFSLKATSQGDTSVDASISQRLEIDMIYAVDIYLRESSSKSGDRSTSVDYSAQVKNVGKNTDEFSLYPGNLPKDWTGSVTPDSVTLTPGATEDVVLTVNIPNTAAVDEYAVIQFLAQVQQEDYDYIYGFLPTATNTTTNNGRTYAVELTTPDDSLKVIPGGEIFYTLSIKNKGDETDSFNLNLEDVMTLGWGSDLSQYSVNNLGPEEVFTIEMNVTSPENSLENDWSLSNVMINSSNREQFGTSLETNTSIRIPIRDLSLVISENSKSGNPDTTVTYSVILINDGSDSDDFSLSTEKCLGCNAWSVTLSTYLVENLGSGHSFNLEMYVKIPSSALDTDSAVLGVVAVSIANSSANDTAESTTTVDTVYNSEITTDDSFRLLNPGESTSFNISVKNKGNSPESFTAQLTSNAPDNWDFDNRLPYTTIALPAYGGTEVFVLPLVIPTNTNAGYYNFTINLILDSSGLKTAELQLSVKIEYFADFSIDITNNHLFGNPGKVHAFDVTIENRANHEEDLSFVIENIPSDWSYCIDTNCVHSIKILKGETKTFKLKINTKDSDPVNIAGRTITLIGTSGLNDKVTVSKTFKVSTNAIYNLEVTTTTNTKTGNIGSIIPFQLTITNKGNAKDYVRLPFPTVPSGWIATYQDNKSSFDLEAQLSETIHLHVQVPSIVYGGDNIIYSKIESDQSGQLLHLNFTVYIKENPKVDVELKNTAGDVTAGTTGTFKVLLTNNGNTIETVNLSLEGKKASWFNLPKTSIHLEPGGYEEIIVEVKPPIMEAAGETSGILNVTLSSDLSVSTKITLPFMVLKSDLVNTEPETTDEGNLLPSLSFIPVLLAISIISLLRRRD